MSLLQQAGGCHFCLGALSLTPTLPKGSKGTALRGLWSIKAGDLPPKEHPELHSRYLAHHDVQTQPGADLLQ